MYLLVATDRNLLDLVRTKKSLSNVQSSKDDDVADDDEINGV